MVIDPLITTAWIQDRGFPCEKWANDHAEIKQQHAPVITVVLLESHWIPVVLIPCNSILHVHTWDAAGTSHEKVEVLVKRLTSALGFDDLLVCRENRMFFTSELCGALAISFVRSFIMGNQLPTCQEEAQFVHANLRSRFVQAISDCQITPRPWVWGSGDNAANANALTPATFESLSMERDQRIDLINEHGPEMADDEMRFHILNLIRHQIPRQILRGSFTFFEPLVFTCWDSIGETIAVQWCSRNQQIFEHGQHVATAVCIERHWIPLWFVPSGLTLQIHTFNDPVDFGTLDLKLLTIARHLGFQEVAMHRVPKLLSDNQRCGAYTLAFLAHVIVRMPLPTTDQELSYLHTNMRASFVQYLYSVSQTPRPVVWGMGPKGESRPLPRMPEEDLRADDLPLLPGLQSPSQAASSSDRPSFRGLNESVLHERTSAIPTHGHAMGDDEILFHLHLIHSKYLDAANASTARSYVVLPPMTIHEWTQGDPLPLIRWSQVFLSGPKCPHILAVMWQDQHWIPIWFEPTPTGVKCHTLHFEQVDQAVTQNAMTEMAAVMGFPESQLHWAPCLAYGSGLCGAMAVSFLAHISLGARLPQDDQQLRSRSWDMKKKFADQLTAFNACMPTLWGWTGVWESGPLPLMPVWDPFVSIDHVSLGEYPPELKCHEGPIAYTRVGMAMGHDEMLYHVRSLMKLSPGLMGCVILPGAPDLQQWLQCFDSSNCTKFVAAFLDEAHWIPVIAYKRQAQLIVAAEYGETSQRIVSASDQWIVCELPPTLQTHCGAMTIRTFVTMLGFQVNQPLVQFHDLLRYQFHLAQGIRVNEVLWGFGPSGLLTKNLVTELLKHGIPADVVETRASAAIRALGSDPIMTALHHRQPWKQLKILGNNANFKFVLPSELDAAVEANKGKPVGGKGKGKSKKGAGRFVSPALDPHKLQILEGTFCFQGKPVSQILPTQIGPLSSGVILMTRAEAEPYLRAGKQVSQEPLGIVILGKCDDTFATSLPHAEVTIPCRCTVDQEPILADAIVVQVGSGLIEKHVGRSVVHMDSFDVVTLKILVYRDELKIDWTDFCQSPIKHLVQILPLLRSCHAEGCQCPHWHNVDKVPVQDPILDVWRRQYLRIGFKPSPCH